MRVKASLEESNKATPAYQLLNLRTHELMLAFFFLTSSLPRFHYALIVSKGGLDMSAEQT
jgi:hypothetical protein